MEHPSTSPAPALTRGLQLLEQLAMDGQASLEHLAGRNQWPKSSTLRYLKTLAQLGLVEQDSLTRHWSARSRIEPLIRPRDHALFPVQQKLPMLASRCHQTAELYQTGNEGIHLYDRADPEGTEVVIRARIGFHRDLTELDATAMILFAFTDTPNPAKRMWQWNAGSKQRITAAHRLQVLKNVRSNGYAVDRDFNENGIRRFAVPILHDASLLGILAMAQRLTPQADRENILILETLTPYIQQEPSA